MAAITIDLNEKQEALVELAIANALADPTTHPDDAAILQVVLDRLDFLCNRRDQQAECIRTCEACAMNPPDGANCHDCRNNNLWRAMMTEDQVEAHIDQLAAANPHM